MSKLDDTLLDLSYYVDHDGRDTDAARIVAKNKVKSLIYSIVSDAGTELMDGNIDMTASNLMNVLNKKIEEL